MNSKFSHDLFKERLNQEKKFFKISENFIPDVRTAPMTSKFWSKYDQFELESNEKNEENLKLIEKSIVTGPKDIFLEPMTESQMWDLFFVLVDNKFFWIISDFSYGWNSEKSLRYDEKDKQLFYHPRLTTDVTVVDQLIAADKTSVRPKFKGMVFRL